ncbi:MAG: CDC27 family protein [Saprospiraceae bacterium]|nr:hypothetical protein [Saprospiraceae bacterium]
MNQEYDFEDIDDYLHGRMSTADRQAMEEEISRNAELANRVKAQRAEAHILQLLREEYLRKQFDDWEKEPPPVLNQVARKNKMVWRWTLITAIGLILLVAGIYFFNTKKNNEKEPASKEPGQSLDTSQHRVPYVQLQDTVDPDKEVKPTAPTQKNYAGLHKRFFEEGQFRITLMGEQSPTDPEDTYEQALTAYEQKKYLEALEKLQPVDPGREPEFRYLRAYTLYHLKRYAEAEKDFHAFRDYRYTDKAFDAQWGEVFCLLAQLPDEDALKRLNGVLKVIRSTENPNAEKARKLINALK